MREKATKGKGYLDGADAQNNKNRDECNSDGPCLDGRDGLQNKHEDKVGVCDASKLLKQVLGQECDDGVLGSAV